MTTLLQGSGLGNLQPNSLLIDWESDWLRDHDFAKTVRQTLEMGKNLLVYSKAEVAESELYMVIDVWWSARANGSMMLTLAYLMQSNRRWREAKIRILRIIKNGDGRDAALESMKELLEEARIDAYLEVVVSAEPPLEVIGTESERSAVTFVGVSIRTLEEEAGAPLVNQVKGNLFLTKNWHDLEL